MKMMGLKWSDVNFQKDSIGNTARNLNSRKQCISILLTDQNVDKHMEFLRKYK